MSWSISYDTNWLRDIGYGVPALCDAPGCDEPIDRGLSHVCGGEEYGGDRGCGLFFCPEHRTDYLCARCRNGKPAYKRPSADVREWLLHKFVDHSWEKWREENPTAVNDIVRRLMTSSASRIISDIEQRMHDAESFEYFKEEFEAILTLRV